MYTTRVFDNESDRYLVVSHPAITPLPNCYRSLLRPLTADGAIELWRDVVTRRGRPVPRCLPPSHWSHQMSVVGPDWVTPWNAWISNRADSADPVRSFLVDTLSWDQGTVVYFIISGNTSFCLPWGAFISCWHYFLHTDQDALLVVQLSSQFVCFGETGLLGVGSRPLSQRFDQGEGTSRL
jgi:hypothetical protein